MSCYAQSLIRLGDTEHLLLLSAHAVAWDTGSAEIVLDELATLYHTSATANRPSLSEPFTQYSGFAHWQLESFEGGDFDEQLAYWKDRLASATQLLSLPTDRSRPPRRTFHTASAMLVFPDALLKRLDFTSTMSPSGCSLCCWVRTKRCFTAIPAVKIS